MNMQSAHWNRGKALPFIQMIWTFYVFLFSFASEWRQINRLVE